MGRSGELLVDDLVTEIDAFVADVDAGTGDQLLDLSLALAAEAAEELLVSIACPGHVSSRCTSVSPRWLLLDSATPTQRCSMTVSMMPYSVASCDDMK